MWKCPHGPYTVFVQPSFHMMQKCYSIHLLLLNLAMLLPITSSATATLSCPNCGTLHVPYPLSTSPDCGNPLYKVRCTKEKLWFDALNGSSYVVSSITPQIQQMIIRPPSFNGSTCATTDYNAGGLWLNESLPFNISSDNTVLKLNCHALAFISAMNCSSTSICFRYIKEEKEVSARCKDKPICCAFTGGGSQNDNNIKLTPEKCAVYTSFVGLPLNTPLPVSKWPEPGVGIKWVPPPEPFCSTNLDCKKLPKSSCLPDAAKGPKRCLCKAPYKWDSIKGDCSKVKCKTSKCRKERKRKITIKALTYTGGIIAILGSFAILIYIHLQRMKRKAREQLVRERQQILNANNTSGRSAKLFSAKEIRNSTSNFAKENVLGSGGFGEVHKGKLQDGTLIAVKRAIYGNTKGNDQVLNEVRILCQVNHRSLVRLLGCCVELEEPVLVYEFISNGTLYDRLHGSNSSDHIEAPLNWKQRLTMARQIAEGLVYLHFSSVPPIIHRDIKTTNILLDHKLDIKISDFGLSRIVDDEATHMTTCAQGTLGYLDPQYYRDMQLTDKSDVYSFGVVLLELLTTRKAIDFSKEVENVSLVSYMRKMVDKKILLDAVDPFLKKGASKLVLETMRLVGVLAISCLDDQRHNRPSMREVTDEIEYMLHIIQDKGAK